MAIGIKKFGDPHVYTVLSYDDLIEDPYYCVVKYDPVWKEATHPNRVSLSENDWERVDRDQVEFISRDWAEVACACQESFELYFPGEDYEDCRPQYSEKIANALDELRKGTIGIEKLEELHSLFSYVYRLFYPYKFDTSERAMAESYTQLNITDMCDVWSRTTLVQPHLIELHIGIVNKLIQEKQIG